MLKSCDRIENRLLDINPSYSINDQVGLHVVERFKKLRAVLIEVYDNPKSRKADFRPSYVTPWVRFAGKKRKEKRKEKAGPAELLVVTEDDSSSQSEGDVESAGKGKGKTIKKKGKAAKATSKNSTWKIVRTAFLFCTCPLSGRYLPNIALSGVGQDQGTRSHEREEPGGRHPARERDPGWSAALHPPVRLEAAGGAEVGRRHEARRFRHDYRPVRPAPRSEGRVRPSRESWLAEPLDRASGLASPRRDGYEVGSGGWGQEKPTLLKHCSHGSCVSLGVLYPSPPAVRTSADRGFDALF